MRAPGVLTRLRDHLWPGAAEARRHLEESEAGREQVEQLAAELRALQRRNHFSANLQQVLGGGHHR